MKRQRFRLAQVLRYNALQKQRTEMELHQTHRALQEAETAIARLTQEIAAVATQLHGAQGARLTVAGWLACYRKAELLDKDLAAARLHRDRQLTRLGQLQEQRKRWAIAEET